MIDTPTRQALIEECQGLVRSLAAGIHRKLPKHVELADLISYGQVGLAEAARDFDATRGSRFSTFAYYRIRGAIYDGLAKMSWFSRVQYNRLRYEQMAGEVQRQDTEESEPTPPDLDAGMRWFRDLGRSLAVVYLASRLELKGEGGTGNLADPSLPSPPEAVIAGEIKQRLHELIDALPVDAGTLIRSIYFEGCGLQEAGRKLGISKSWASRLHAKTLKRLARDLRLAGSSE